MIGQMYVEVWVPREVRQPYPSSSCNNLESARLVDGWLRANVRQAK